MTVAQLQTTSQHTIKKVKGFFVCSGCLGRAGKGNVRKFVLSTCPGAQDLIELSYMDKPIQVLVQWRARIFAALIK